VSFEWPIGLLALLVLPLAVAGYVAIDRRRAGDAARFATPALFPNVVSRAPGRLRHLPVAILLLGVAVLLTGFARPQATVSVAREEATVMLVLDVSRSMTATDVSPTRLAAAQSAARQFLGQVPDAFRVGVVTFTTRANIATPPTDDREVAAAALSQIRPGEGTALGEAIILSVQAAQAVRGERPDERPPASILLISDGAQTQGRVSPARAAQRARAAGVPVYTVLVGTPEGVVERRLPGGYTERIRVPPDPTALRQVAGTSRGQFFQAADRERLSRVYKELGSRLGHRQKRAEITVAFAGVGMGLLLVAGAVSTLTLRRLP
jgi:Ca-activated chloride channel homolog